MDDSDRIPRRTVVRAAGLAVSTAALAGCVDESSVDGSDESNGEGARPSAEGEPTDDDSDEESAADENGAEDDADEDAGPVEIELSAHASHWRGVAPNAIAGEENPTLELRPGATYRLGWTEGDGSVHNIEIRDEDGDVVDGLATEEVSDEEPDDQWLEFEATEEMAAYACAPHENDMSGRVHVGESDGRDSSDEGEESEPDPIRIEPGATIELAATTASWDGIAPTEIAGTENPTLVLERGATYEIGWSEGDGVPHNVELRNDDGEVVDDLATEVTDAEEPDDQFIVFEASEELASYVCLPHESTMHGEIRIED